MTLFGKKCVNKSTPKGVAVGGQVPHLCPPEPLPISPEALFCSPEPHVTEIMPQKRVGVTLGAQVSHVATYSDPPKGSFFYQKVSKTVFKGGTPCF